MSELTEQAQREVLREEILKMTAEAEPIGTSLQVLRAGLKKLDMDVSEAELETQVNYLEGKGLLHVERLRNDRLGIKRTVAHITPAGTDVLEGNGVVSGVSCS
ncbi:MAG: hypothetical protein OSJ71_00975 [Acetatifactor sp.]|nr:hypothetical protein [Acetatifactor sp.]